MGSFRRSSSSRLHYPSGSKFSSTSVPNECSTNPNKDSNPDPYNYKFVKVEEVGSHLVVKINYPNCTNYEGNKILVFKDTPLVNLINQKGIDPHFLHPFARFAPTDEGWEMVVKLCNLFSKE